MNIENISLKKLGLLFLAATALAIVTNLVCGDSCDSSISDDFAIDDDY